MTGRDLPNTWAGHGLVYMNVYWEDKPTCNLFTKTVLEDMAQFIDISINNGISVLLFSRRGTGRCCAAAIGYMMLKFGWGFEKSYDFVYSKKRDVALNKGFVQQFFALDKKLIARRQQIIRTSGVNVADPSISDIEASRWKDWDTSYLKNGTPSTARRHVDIEASQTADDDADEELLLINSFLNSRSTAADYAAASYDHSMGSKLFRLRFNDTLHEEGINMFPTTPSSPSKKAARGVLKWNTSAGNQSLKGLNDSKKGDPRVNNWMTGPEHSRAPPKTAVETYRSNADTLHSDMKKLPLDQYPGNRKAREDEIASSSSSSSSHHLEAVDQKPKKAISHTEDSALYDFVGMGSSTRKSNETVSPMMMMTAEERIRHLVADLTVQSSQSSQQHSNSTGGPSKGRDRHHHAAQSKDDWQHQKNDIIGGNRVGASEEKWSRQNGGGQSDYNDYKAESKTDQSRSSPNRRAQSKDGASVSSASTQQAPSLYDLATMHLPYASSQNTQRKGPQNPPKQQQQQQQQRQDDPLAAFEAFQQGGGAIKVRHDVWMNTKGEFVDTGPPSMVVGRASFGSADRSGPAAYRHGSPKNPRRPNNAANSSDGNRSISSINSVSSLGTLDSSASNNVRGQQFRDKSNLLQPTASSQRRLSFSSQSSQRSTGSQQSRSGSPIVKDRPASPGVNKTRPASPGGNVDRRSGTPTKGGWKP